MPFMIDQPHRPECSQYIYFENLFSDEECEKIVGFHKELPESIGKVGSLNNGFIPEKRRSKIHWINWEQSTDWIFAKMAPSIFKGNHHWWNFHLSAMSEPLQLTHYSDKDKGHYDWHEDSALGGVLSTRKLSCVILLNDNFEGGDFELVHSGAVPELKKGTMVVFPSFILHRVTPVTRGERWSLVSWVSGPPFV